MPASAHHRDTAASSRRRVVARAFFRADTLAACLGVGSLLWVGWMYWMRQPPFDNYASLVNGALTPAQNQAIDMVVELNKYLVSLATLVWGGLAFVMAHRGQRPTRAANLALVVVPVLLAATYYFAFNTYAGLTDGLAQNALALMPGQSVLLFNLEMEFWAFACGAICVLVTMLATIGSEPAASGGAKS